MKNIAFIVATSAAALFSQSAFAGLLLAPGFESPAAPDAFAADQNTPLTPATQNPWYGPRAGQQAYSSSAQAFSGASPARNRIAGPAGNAAPASAYEGTQYAYAYSVSSTFGYVAQDVTGASVVAGHSYTGSAYFMNKAASGADGDRLQAGGSVDQVRLLFLDSAGVQIGATAISASSVNSTTPQNVWTPISVTAVAPIGTATITFQAYLQRGATGGVMFVDAADLVDNGLVPEPVSASFLAAGATLLGRRRRL